MPEPERLSLRKDTPEYLSAEWHDARADDLAMGNIDGITQSEADELIALHRIAAKSIRGENG